MVQAVLRDYRTSPLPQSEKALLALVQKVNASAREVKLGDIEEVKRAGWSEEAIYDAITVCALFNFYNRWVDASGVRELSPEACRVSARELAARGYVCH